MHTIVCHHLSQRCTAIPSPCPGFSQHSVNSTQEDLVVAEQWVCALGPLCGEELLEAVGRNCRLDMPGLIYLAIEKTSLIFALTFPLLSVIPFVGLAVLLSCMRVEIKEIGNSSIYSN